MLLIVLPLLLGSVGRQEPQWDRRWDATLHFDEHWIDPCVGDADGSVLLTPHSPRSGGFVFSFLFAQPGLAWVCGAVLIFTFGQLPWAMVVRPLDVMRAVRLRLD